MFYLSQYLTVLIIPVNESKLVFHISLQSLLLVRAGSCFFLPMHFLLLVPCASVVVSGFLSQRGFPSEIHFLWLDEAKEEAP